MRITAVLAALGLAAVPALAPSASAEEAPGFCASVREAARHAPTGFKDIRSFGRLTNENSAYLENDYIHTVSVQIEGASCFVRTRWSDDTKDAQMQCSFPVREDADANQVVQALYARVSACLPGDTAKDMPAGRSPWGPYVHEAYVQRPGVRIRIDSAAGSPLMYSNARILMMMGGPESSIGVYRPTN